MFTTTPIKDLLVYTPKVFGDHRGHFFESYNHKHFLEAGLEYQFVQDNRSTSKKGTLRGLHLQTGASAQTKFVSVLQGHVYDVAVDLREDSPTFAKWFGIHLTDEKPQSLLIPRGFAHGFVVLSETADFFYKVDNYYDKSAEAGIIFNDRDINIDWLLPTQELTLSEKDMILPTLEQFRKHKA
ncbi:MAG: dTDP-4-dehydrorhamnose 3,5-epimerase [Bdellovibrionaceae bacterium]|nr:dTDP-4-dehydrorhamnose 3,5-epimerase [Pseudobdellovibrionaceae bacterium]